MTIWWLLSFHRSGICNPTIWSIQGELFLSPLRKHTQCMCVCVCVQHLVVADAFCFCLVCFVSLVFCLFICLRERKKAVSLTQTTHYTLPQWYNVNHTYNLWCAVMLEQVCRTWISSSLKFICLDLLRCFTLFPNIVFLYLVGLFVCFYHCINSDARKKAKTRNRHLK